MSDASAEKRDFLVSFNQADNVWANWIAWTLEEAGYTVWFQDWDFRGNFVENMNLAYNRANRTVAVISDHYFGSDFTLAEWSARFAQDPAAREDRLIPVKVGPLTGEGILSALIHADLTGCDEEEAQQRLLERVRKAIDPSYRAKPAERPKFPRSKEPKRQVAGKPQYPTPEVLAMSGKGQIFEDTEQNLEAIRYNVSNKHIFISYSNEDGDFAELVKGYLESHGFKVWVDENRLLPGNDWKSDIDDAIKNSAALIVIMSPDAKLSEYVSYEWAFAWGSGIKLIPILLKKTELHPRLDSLQYIDFTNRPTRPWDKLINFLNTLYYR